MSEEAKISLVFLRNGCGVGDHTYNEGDVGEFDVKMTKHLLRSGFAAPAECKTLREKADALHADALANIDNIESVLAPAKAADTVVMAGSQPASATLVEEKTQASTGKSGK